MRKIKRTTVSLKLMWSRNEYNIQLSSNNFNDFALFYYLTIERLSAKMCTFAHVIYVREKTKITQRADFCK
jgi:hypothetical protein